MTQDERDKLLIRAVQAAEYQAEITQACGAGVAIGLCLAGVLAGIIALILIF